MPSATTPTALGFRMPAEWEQQAAVWLSWPHRRSTWPGNFRPIPAKFAEIAAVISRRETVRLNLGHSLQKGAKALLAAGRGGPGQSRILRSPHR